MRLMLLCCCLCTCLIGAERVTITTKTVIRSDAGRVLGINCNYLTDGPRWSNDPGNERLIAALRAMKPAWLRFPGGEKADTHAFAAPPYRQAAPQLLRTGAGEWPAMDHRFTEADGSWIPGREPMSFDEFMYVCRAVGAKPLIVLPYDSAYRTAPAEGRSPGIDELLEHAVAWLQYANIDHDYQVLHWSLGNETDYKQSRAEGNPGAEQYARDLQRFATAMQAVDPRVRIGAQGHSKGWFTTVLSQAGDAVGFLDVHDYAGWNWNDGYHRFLDTRPDLSREAGMALGVVTELGRPLPVIVSEMGVKDWSGSWQSRNDLAHALVLCDMIGQHLQRSGVAGLCYWNTRWIDNDLVSLPLGPDLLAPVGIDLQADGWQQQVPDDQAGIAEGFTDAEARGLQLRGAVGLTRELPPGLLEAGRSYTLAVRLRPEQEETWCGIGIDLLKGGEKIASHAINGTGKARWYSRSVAFRVPAGCDGARLWVWSFAGTGLRLASCRLRQGVEPSSLDALSPDGGLLASGQVLALWGQLLGGDLLRSEATGGIGSWACREGTESRLLLLNPSAEIKEVEVVMVDRACQGEATRRAFSGSGLDDLQPRTVDAEPLKVVDGRCQLQLAPHSITLLSCRSPDLEP